MEGTKDASATADFKLSLSKDSLLTPEHVTATIEFAKANKIAPEVAQKIIARDEALAAAKKTEWGQTVMGWNDAIKADKELGGDNLAQTKANVHAVMSRFAPPGFAELLNETGFGNQPELVRFVSKIGAAMTEGKLDTNVRPTSDAVDPIALLFPSMANNK